MRTAKMHILNTSFQHMHHMTRIVAECYICIRIEKQSSALYIDGIELYSQSQQKTSACLSPIINRVHGGYNPLHMTLSDKVWPNSMIHKET